MTQRCWDGDPFKRIAAADAVAILEAESTARGLPPSECAGT